LFLLFARSSVAPKYRIAVLISATVPAIACYHYFRITSDFKGAYQIAQNGMYTPTGQPFNDFYRYADWIITVPLLVIELVAVLGLSAKKTFSLSWRLATAAVLMIILGYPGEISDDAGTRWTWWVAGMIPFIYILVVLFTEFGSTYKDMAPNVRTLINAARFTLLVTWTFYPIAYLGPMLGLSDANAEVFLQVGYTFADILAKVGFGILILAIAVQKSKADGWYANEPSTADAQPA
jgi:bacteriorhodopsin